MTNFKSGEGLRLNYRGGSFEHSPQSDLLRANGFLAANATRKTSSNWHIKFNMELFNAWKMPSGSTQGLGSSSQGPALTSPAACVGREIVYEGESPLRAE